MTGTDDNAATVSGADWPPPDFLTDGLTPRPFSELLAGDADPTTAASADDGFRFLAPPSVAAAQRPGGARSGLAERAARAGFSAPTINTADVPSPYVTIPPGLSPTMLLESPVFLSNSMAQPSPTTGKFSFEECKNTNLISSTGVPKTSKDHPLQDITGSFSFKPPLESNSSYFTSVGNKGTSSIEHQQSLPSTRVSVPSEQAGVIKNQQNFRVQAGLSDSSVKNDASDDVMFDQRISDSFNGNEHSSPPEDQLDEGDPKGESSVVAVGAPAEDGYNWRKYGQKQVKGSEYPRSYYKCTHPNCQVKKKVERSHEGHITEIIYKGAHNHPKPPPNRRSGISSHPYNEMQLDGSENPSSQIALDGKSPLWTSTQNWRNDGREPTSLASVPTEFMDPSAPLVAQEGPRFESDLIDVSTTQSNDEDDDDGATHGSASVGAEGEGDETESKRRKLDTCAMEMSAASRAVREPRVVVQTTSEVDILDDGYRWRKYGQKVVKGNPNPRSYYKCTNPGCSVRKHVERASHDLKSVITTYEGKHNHDVPAARNSGNTSSGPASTAASSQSQSHDLHRRPEPQVQDSLMRFDNRAPLGAFGLPGREQLGPSASFHFGMGQQGLTNLGIAGLNAVAPLKMPGLPHVHPYMVGHHQQVIDGGFMVPKGELKEEPALEAGLPMPNSATVYHQIMGRLPLGPQL